MITIELTWCCVGYVMHVSSLDKGLTTLQLNYLRYMYHKTWCITKICINYFFWLALVISESKGYKHKMNFDPFKAMSVGWKKLCCNIGTSFAPVTLNPQCNYPHVTMLIFAISLMTKLSDLKSCSPKGFCKLLMKAIEQWIILRINIHKFHDFDHYEPKQILLKCFHHAVLMAKFACFSIISFNDFDCCKPSLHKQN